MLYDFKFHNPTRIHFWKETLSESKGKLENCDDTVLLAYGKAAIKRIGLYDKVVARLKASGKTIVELEGVMPNPTYAKAVAASAYCEEDAYKSSNRNEWWVSYY